MKPSAMNTHAPRKIINHRGAIFVLFAVTIPFLIAFSSIAVDMAYIYAEKEHMQNAVDAATLAGANNLKLDGSNDTTVKKIVQKYVVYNNENTDTIKDENAIKIIHNTNEGYSTIQVIMTRDIPLHFMKYFLKPFGITTMKAAVTATGKNIPETKQSTGSKDIEFNLGNSKLFTNTVVANKIIYSYTYYNNSTKLRDSVYRDYYTEYLNQHGQPPGYYGWDDTYYAYDQQTYNDKKNYYYLQYHNDVTQDSLRYGDTQSATIEGTSINNSKSRHKTDISLSSSTTSNTADLIQGLSQLLPSDYVNALTKTTSEINKLTPYTDTSKGVYFNTNTNPVSVNFKYKVATDNPENPNYIKDVKHSGGDVTIGGVKYSIIISDGDINTMNLDNQNSSLVLLISLHGNVTIDEDTAHHHFNGIVYAPNGTVTVKTPYDGSIVGNEVKLSPYFWAGEISPVDDDDSYYGIDVTYKYYKNVYPAEDYKIIPGAVSLIR